ncbi:MAG: pyruvate ferredoxin oxidoreductase [Theionarchaea archaeon]|nr:MAG: pyruvate ferredoxin oxidoreductase [Theionarchaea archaeon DG-70]MBU7009904.1 pyruvate ferredoxin oxidoreductase [Theionarchaea archaeon]
MSTVKVISGNHAASYGARDSRAQVVAAYPITPQTQVVELLSEFCADGTMDAKFIKVESEHSAMAACIGASAAGARAYTATSSHGLALMHEMLHWAANGRHPVVMANINRAMGPPWSIWTDQNDSLAQRDTGWLQFYCESNQEVYDTTVIAFKICEQVFLPGMLILDAFILSHTYEPVAMPDQELIDEFLPPFDPPYKMDLEDPRAFGALTTPEWYMELRYLIEEAHEKARKIARNVEAEFAETFGREYGVVEFYRCEDAEEAIVIAGSTASTAKDAVDIMRRNGRKIGLARLKLFRPFPNEEIRDLASMVNKIIVIDRNISFGNQGIFFNEIKACLYNQKNTPPVYGFIAGLGGRDMKIEDITGIVEQADTCNIEEILWWGVKL